MTAWDILYHSLEQGYNWQNTQNRVLDLLEQVTEKRMVQKLFSIMERLLTHSTTQYSNTIRYRKYCLQLLNTLYNSFPFCRERFSKTHVQFYNFAHVQI